MSSNVIQYLCTSVETILKNQNVIENMLYRICQHLNIQESFEFNKISSQQDFDEIESKIKEDVAFSAALREHTKKKCGTNLQEIVEFLLLDEFIHEFCNTDGKHGRIKLPATALFTNIVYDLLRGRNKEKSISSVKKEQSQELSKILTRIKNRINNRNNKQSKKSILLHRHEDAQDLELELPQKKENYKAVASGDTHEIVQDLEFESPQKEELPNGATSEDVGLEEHNEMLFNEDTESASMNLLLKEDPISHYDITAKHMIEEMPKNSLADSSNEVDIREYEAIEEKVIILHNEVPHQKKIATVQYKDFEHKEWTKENTKCGLNRAIDADETKRTIGVDMTKRVSLEGLKVISLKGLKLVQVANVPSTAGLMTTSNEIKGLKQTNLTTPGVASGEIKGSIECMTKSVPKKELRHVQSNLVPIATENKVLKQWASATPGFNEVNASGGTKGSIGVGMVKCVSPKGIKYEGVTEPWSTILKHAHTTNESKVIKQWVSKTPGFNKVDALTEVKFKIPTVSSPKLISLRPNAPPKRKLDNMDFPWNDNSIKKKIAIAEPKEKNQFEPKAQVIYATKKNVKFDEVVCRKGEIVTIQPAESERFRNFFVVKTETGAVGKINKQNIKLLN